MEKIVLSAVLRDLEVKTSDIRADKMVPAVVYGHNVAPIHVSVSNSDFLRVFRKAGTSHIIELSVDGKKYNVLAHEVQQHPVSGDFLHVDFFAVNAKEKVHVQVPVHLTGRSQAATEGADIDQNIHHVEIKALPADLIDAIEVDIAKIEKVGDVIHLSDIAALYPKIEFLTPLTDALVGAHMPKEVLEVTGAPEAIVAPEATAQKSEESAA